MISKIAILTILSLLLLANINCASESERPENLFTNSTAKSTEPIVCTLTEPDLIKRKEKLKKELFSKIIKKEEVGNGYIFFFKDEEGMLPKLANFIVEEQQCCKFFHYDLSIQSNGKGIALKVSGPIGAKLMIESL